MGAACVAQDRLDIGHAVKNLARGMVTPTEANLADLKRLIRYFKRYPDVAQVSAAISSQRSSFQLEKVNSML